MSPRWGRVLSCVLFLLVIAVLLGIVWFLVDSVQEEMEGRRDEKWWREQENRLYADPLSAGLRTYLRIRN